MPYYLLEMLLFFHVEPVINSVIFYLFKNNFTKKKYIIIILLIFFVYPIIQQLAMQPIYGSNADGLKNMETLMGYSGVYRMVIGLPLSFYFLINKGFSSNKKDSNNDLKMLLINYNLVAFIPLIVVLAFSMMTALFSKQVYY